MQLKKKVLYSGIIAAITLITSIFIPIIPCRTAPGVPNPIYKWTLCSLNPDKITGGSITEFFGYTTSLRDSYLLTLLITFVVAMVLLHYATRRKKKN